MTAVRVAGHGHIKRNDRRRPFMNCAVCGRWTEVTEFNGEVETALCYRHAIRPRARKLEKVLGRAPKY